MTTYYISSDGDDDANNGVSEATPWRTLAKVNATAFLPGDSILFRRGDMFRGSLVCSSSGTVDERITYASYGTGETPIINGATLIENGSFSLYAGVIESSAWVYQSDAANIDDGAVRNYRVLFPASTIISYGTGVKITFSAGFSDWPIVGAGIGKRTTGQNVESITRITFNSGDNSVTVPGNGSIVSDSVPFTIEEDSDYIITIYTASRHLTLRNYIGVTSYYNTTATDQSQTTTQAYANTTADMTPGISEITLNQSGEVKVYEASLAADPRLVWEDYDRMTPMSSIGACNNTAGSWYHDSTAGKLYIHPRDSENPILNGRQYDAGNSTTIMMDNYKDYNTIMLDCCNSVGTEAVFGGVVMGGTGTVFSGRSFNSERHCISYCNGSENCIAENFQAFNSDDAAVVSFSASSPGCVDNITRNGEIYQTSKYTGALIGTHGGEYSSDNWTISGNSFGNVYGTLTYQGWFFCYGGTGKLSFVGNQFSGNAVKTIELNTAVDIDFLGNVFQINDAANINEIVKIIASSRLRFFHNTFVGHDSTEKEIFRIMSGSSGTVIENNIIMANGPLLNVDADSIASTSINNNCYPQTTAGLFTYAGSVSDLAGWISASGFDAGSITEESDNIEPNGKIVDGSSCINSAPWVSQVNDTGDLIDPWGCYVHRLPNIGADQGAGAPGSIQIVFR